jgi:uncharacterized protein (TIGR00369 family)
MKPNPIDAMPFSKLMGVVVNEVTPQKIRGQIEVRDELCTAGGIMHGGAIMAFADALGAIGAYLTLPDGAQGTTTIESKTNFLGPAPVGSKVHATTTPVKTGARMSVWQTDVFLESGRKVALITQSQMVL